MNTTCSTTRDSVLAKLMEDYLASCEAGQPLTAEELVQRYPELADDVAACLASLKFIEQAAQGRPRTPCGPIVEWHMASPTADGPPSQLGPYQLLAELGRGGMGIVYRARHTQLDRTVALKMIRAGHLASPAEIERFRAEAAAAASLDHPNIVPIYEVGQHAGQHYFTMKLIEGGSLADILTRSVSEGVQQEHEEREGEAPAEPASTNPKSSIPNPKSAALLIAQIASAVHYAHQRGILHRDLKPSNILLEWPVGGRHTPCAVTVTKQEHDDSCPPNPKSKIQNLKSVLEHCTPYVTDFGLAKRVESDNSLTHTGDIIGTPLYMAPEQAAGQKHLTTAADIYSLGAILYWLLTGKPAIQAATPLETLRQVQDQEPIRPRSLNATIDRDLETICLKCLEKDPFRRYPSAAALADDLNHWLSGDPILARPLSRPERLLRFCRKSPLVASLSASLIILAFVSLFGILTQWQAALASEQKSIANEERAVASEQKAIANEQKAITAAANAKEQAQVASQHRNEAERQRDEVKSLNDRMNRTLYAAHMNLAKHAWEAGATERVLELLNQHRPRDGETDLRGFEWHYLNRLCNANQVELKGLMGRITNLAFSPDTKRVATGLLPDRAKVPAGSWDGTLKIWDAQTGNESLTLNGLGGSPYGIAFSPDGRRLAATTLLPRERDKPAIGRLMVWDSVSGKRVFSMEGADVGALPLVYSHNGRMLASAGNLGSDTSIRLRDAETGAELMTLKNDGSAGAIAFSPDDKRLLYGTAIRWDEQNNDRPAEAKVYSLESGEELLNVRPGGSQLFSVAFSPDGRQFACSLRPAITVWDATSGALVQRLNGHGLDVYCMAFSASGKRLISASKDQTVKGWDLETGKEAFTLRGHSSPVFAVVFTPDEKSVISAAATGGVAIKSWRTDWPQAAVLLNATSAGHSVFSPDGSRVAGTKGNLINIWDARTGEVLLSCSGHAAPVYRVRFSPDGTRLVSGSFDATVKLWDSTTGRELRTMQGHRSRIHDVTYSPDGKHVASASWDSTAKIWSTDAGEVIHTLKHGAALFGVAYSPDGKRVATAGSDATVNIWDSETGQAIITLKGAEGNCVRVVFSPDGKRVACGSGDKTALVWNVTSGELLLRLKGHAGSVHRIAYSPNGKRIATGAYDHSVKLWDAETGEEVLSLLGSAESSFPSMDFSSDSNRLVAGSGKRLAIFDATPLPENP